jgi:hypothetical protein
MAMCNGRIWIRICDCRQTGTESSIYSLSWKTMVAVDWTKHVGLAANM